MTSASKITIIVFVFLLLHTNLGVANSTNECTYMLLSSINFHKNQQKKKSCHQNSKFDWFEVFCDPQIKRNMYLVAFLRETTIKDHKAFFFLLP